MKHVGLAGGAHLALMMLEGKLPGAADNLDIVAGTMGAHGVQQRAEARVDQCSALPLPRRNPAGQDGMQ